MRGSVACEASPTDTTSASVKYIEQTGAAVDSHRTTERRGLSALSAIPGSAHFSSAQLASSRCLSRPHFRACHRHPLGHRSNRPNQANRYLHCDSDPCAHLHPLCVVLSLAISG